MDRSRLSWLSVLSLLLVHRHGHGFVPRHQSLSLGTTTSWRAPSVLTPLNAAKSKSKKSAGGKKQGGSKKVSGGFGASTAKSDDVTAALKEAVGVQRKALRANPYDPDSWVRYGAYLMKLGEYAEAERAFELGAKTCPGNEMLDASLLTLQGHSSIYYHGERTMEVVPPPPDEDFATFDVPPQPSGWVSDPDRHDAQLSRKSGARLVHASKVPVIDPAECAWAIEAAERHAAANGGWLSDRHASAPTTDMAIKDVPELLAWFNEKLETCLFPMLAARFPDQISDPDDIRVHDGFIVRYDATGQNSLAVHQDESTFSFTIALNSQSEYEGGGTFFEAIRPTAKDGEISEEAFVPGALNADAGGVVCFGGKLRHGGQAISSGRRYIIPLFVYLDANKSGSGKTKTKKGYSLESIKETLAPS